MAQYICRNNLIISVIASIISLKDIIISLAWVYTNIRWTVQNNRLGTYPQKSHYMRSMQMKHPSANQTNP